MNNKGENQGEETYMMTKSGTVCVEKYGRKKCEKKNYQKEV